MRFKFVRDYAEISPLVDGPFNDPQQDPGYDEDEFNREYEAVREGIQAIAFEHCDVIRAPKDAINVGHRTGPSRGIGLVVEENATGQLSSLIDRIQNYLEALPESYCVAINLVLDEAGDFKDLNIGITRSGEILLHADKAKWFREVGIHC